MRVCFLCNSKSIKRFNKRVHDCFAYGCHVVKRAQEVGLHSTHVNIGETYTVHMNGQNKKNANKTKRKKKKNTTEAITKIMGKFQWKLTCSRNEGEKKANPIRTYAYSMGPGTPRFFGCRILSAGETPKQWPDSMESTKTAIN